jgi:hypothetical protein
MFKIGAKDWVKDLKSLTEPLGHDFWSSFTPASEEQLRAVETTIGRKLDPEFREFYRTLGYGSFPNFGEFDSPEDLMRGLSAPIFFVTGSLFSGWASKEEHERLWLTRGAENPNPAKFTADVLTLDDVKLYDLLQFGSNGCCCYHQLYVGPEPAPLRYCLLTDSQEIEDRAASFSEGLEKIIGFHLLDTEGM